MPGEPSYWELVSRIGGNRDANYQMQHATIYKMGKRKWELRIWDNRPLIRGLQLDITYHPTLSAAKAVGIVKVRFNQASN